MIPKGRSHVFWKSVHAGAVKASREHNVEIAWNGRVDCGSADFAVRFDLNRENSSFSNEEGRRCAMRRMVADR